MSARRLGICVALVLVACSTPARPAAVGQEPIRIGVVTVCEGPLGFSRDATLAGAELPLIDRGATLMGATPEDGITSAPVGGRSVELVEACERSGDRSTTISALSSLVEGRGAQIVVGPFYANDGIAVREYARAHPDVTFLLTSGEQSSTLKRTVPNLYRFEPDQYQWNAPLGIYARRTLGWRTAATFGDVDMPGYQVGGFIAGFCSRGGRVAGSDRLFLDQSPGHDPGSLIPTIRATVDGLFLTGTTAGGPVGGTGTMARRWAQSHTPLKRHLLVGWQPLYPQPARVLRGVVGASPDPFKPTPPWTAYMNAFKTEFPDVSDPGLMNQPFYDAVEPVLEALATVNGDLSDGERRFADTLAHLRYHAPEGLITLDQRHQAIAPIYLGRVVVQKDGSTGVKQIGVFKHVHQTLGGYFSPTTPAPSQTSPACHPLGRPN